MIRGVDSDLLEALEGPFFYPVILVYLDWPSAPVYAHSGAGTISYDGQTWVGVGEFGQVQLPSEAGGLASQFAELRIVGVPDDLDDYLDDEIRGQDGRVLFGAVTERAGTTLIGEPAEIFSGSMDALRDTVEMQDGSTVRGLRLRVSMGPSQRDHAAAYHTPEDQERHYPGDTAGRHVLFAEAEAAKLEW